MNSEWQRALLSFVGCGRLYRRVLKRFQSLDYTKPHVQMLNTAFLHQKKTHLNEADEDGGAIAAACGWSLFPLAGVTSLFTGIW